MTVSMMKSTACLGSSSMTGSGSTGPSSPLSPWIESATSTSRTRGRWAPRAKGTPVMPATRATDSALRVTFSIVWFPMTVVTPTSSMSGLPHARSRAMASSWPGSQSRMIFVGTVRG